MDRFFSKIFTLVLLAVLGLSLVAAEVPASGPAQARENKPPAAGLAGIPAAAAAVPAITIIRLPTPAAAPQLAAVASCAAPALAPAGASLQDTASAALLAQPAQCLSLARGIGAPQNPQIQIVAAAPQPPAAVSVAPHQALAAAPALNAHHPAAAIWNVPPAAEFRLAPAASAAAIAIVLMFAFLSYILAAPFRILPLWQAQVMRC